MNYSQDQIQRFMEIGETNEKFFLRWFGKESFFDKDVQKVLSQFHPKNYSYPDMQSIGFPVDAWSNADQVCLCASEPSWMQLLPLWQRMPLWTAELLAAIMHFRQKQVERMKNPIDALDQIEAWRNERYLWEQNPYLAENENGELTDYSLSREEIVKLNTLAKRERERLAHFSPGEQQALREHGKLRGIPPLPIIEPLKAPKEWMDGKRTLSSEAYRQARLKEDRRRDDIMLLWAESWLAHLGQTPSKTA